MPSGAPVSLCSASTAAPFRGRSEAMVAALELRSLLTTTCGRAAKRGCGQLLKGCCCPAWPLGNGQTKSFLARRCPWNEVSLVCVGPGQAAQDACGKDARRR